MLWKKGDVAKMDEKEIAKREITFSLLLIPFVLFAFYYVHPFFKQSELKKEALQEGKKVEAVVVDKHFKQTSIGNSAPFQYALKIYANDKLSEVNVSEALYDETAVGNKISAVEYENHVALTKQYPYED